MLDGHVMRITVYLKSTQERCIVGQELLRKEDLYTVPVQLLRLGICTVSDLLELKVWLLHNVRKIVGLP